MPIYEYECPRCGRFDLMQKITEAPLAQHSCGAQVRRLISATSFSLQGTGWYVTDYARKGSSGEKKDSAQSSASAST